MFFSLSPSEAKSRVKNQPESTLMVGRDGQNLTLIKIIHTLFLQQKISQPIMRYKITSAVLPENSQK